MKILLILLALLPFNVSALNAYPGAYTLLPPLSRTTTTTSEVIHNAQSIKCGHVIVNVSAYTAGSITAHVQGYVNATGTYYDLLVSPALTATGTTVLKVCPGITAVANGATADFIPTQWQVQLVAADATPITYSVSLELMQ